MFASEPILSRHRLPRFYRVSLALLWALPPLLLLATVGAGAGLSALLTPPPLLAAALMLLPAVYIWNEGVDVLPGGIVRRVHLPRYLPYGGLADWQYDAHPDRRVLVIWDARCCKVVECRAGHLSDLPVLLAALRANIRR